MELKSKVVIPLVLIIVGLLFYSFNAIVVGNLTIGNSMRGSCSDTDDGIPGSELVKGTVSGERDNGASFERTDYCIDAYQLKEYRCDLSESSNFDIGSESINGNGNAIFCPNGCSNGACKR